MKKFIYLAMLMLAASTANAAQVSSVFAQQTAQRYLMSKASNGRLMATVPSVKGIREERNFSRADMAAYHVVNTDRGFVIVSRR